MSRVLDPVEAVMQHAGTCVLCFKYPDGLVDPSCVEGSALARKVEESEDEES